MSKSRIMAIGIAGAAALGAAFLANNFLNGPVEKQVVEVNNVSMTPILVALQNIDVDKELAVAREQIAGSKKSARDATIRKLGYLKAAQLLGAERVFGKPISPKKLLEAVRALVGPSPSDPEA